MIYLVTEGEYSDYHVAAVFSTREKAEAYLADLSAFGSMCRNVYAIEEMPLDEMPVRAAGAFRSWIDKTGREFENVWKDGADPHAPAMTRGFGIFEGYGETREHARRSAEEFRRVYEPTPRPAETIAPRIIDPVVADVIGGLREIRGDA